MLFLILIVTLIAAIIYLYRVDKKKSTYWLSKGVPQVKHTTILGILWNYITHDGSLGEVYERIYREFSDAPYVGAFIGNDPNLILRDPKLIQIVLRTEFHSFYSRGVSTNWKEDKLADNVLFMEGVRWKIMRQKLTPVFTGGKLRNMFHLIEQSAKEFETVVDNMHDKGYDYMDILTTFTTASIGASVFGIDTRPNTNFDSPIQNMVRETNNPTVTGNMKFVFGNLCPRMFQWMGFKIFGNHEIFFIGVVQNILRSRQQEGVKRYDFIDTCLEIQKEGKLRDATTGYEMETTDELMAAQAFFYFIAGVDTTATAIHFMLFELARNPQVLAKLLQEVDDIFTEYGENLTYDAIEKLEYLEKVLNESLRMYPPIGSIQRKCVEDCVFPDGTKISKGVLVTIPILAIQRDAKFYPNPDVFDPERFSPETEKERPNYTFLPFGEGNRICIGLRFAKLQMKTGMVHLLRKFTVTTTASSSSPYAAAERPKFEKSIFSTRSSYLNYKLSARQH